MNEGYEFKPLPVPEPKRERSPGAPVFDIFAYANATLQEEEEEFYRKQATAKKYILYNISKDIRNCLDHTDKVFDLISNCAVLLSKRHRIFSKRRR